ncbi:hypothetical protein Micbo1qcDRAFT_205859 [Microdochium bolleyi]|uniref:Uncharacterized protein n=1 Tax=Microdochium bolleyi TaxID=196109 RepID=A0A136IZ39_9PEZI|nr:hypothetical protein Micbo1qcDRAFT_205859 [Microdochium bolleyi]
MLIRSKALGTIAVLSMASGALAHPRPDKTCSVTLQSASISPLASKASRPIYEKAVPATTITTTEATTVANAATGTSIIMDMDEQPASNYTCYRWFHLIYLDWEVRAPAVVSDNMPGLCGGLWDNMKGFGNCEYLSSTHCGAEADGSLLWKFTSPVTCSNDAIEASWTRATYSKQENVTCVRGPR